jgi:hypothetical protein
MREKHEDYGEDFDLTKKFLKELPTHYLVPLANEANYSLDLSREESLRWFESYALSVFTLCRVKSRCECNT